MHLQMKMQLLQLLLHLWQQLQLMMVVVLLVLRHDVGQQSETVQFTWILSLFEIFFTG